MSKPVENRPHLVKIQIDSRRLFQRAPKSLDVGGADLGYAVHCLLAATFGAEAPGPFAVTGIQGRRTTVLGVSGSDATTLARDASTFADPEDHQSIDWESFASKPLPVEWPAKTRYRFSVRAVPVRRVGKTSTRVKGGAEVDAFLTACWEAGDDVAVDRETAYRAWLTEQLGRDGAATLVSCRVASFKLERMVRRTTGEKRCGRRVVRPDVTFEGVLEVANPQSFTALLRRGLGRHRAFGYGLLLLRRE